MSARNKYGLILLVALGLAACSSAPGTSTAAPPSAPAPDPVILAPVASPAAIPASPELLLIEFFAGT